MTSTGRRGHVVVSRSWLADPTLTDSMLRLMLWLDSHSDEYLQALSMKRTAEEIGWSRDRVKRTLDSLEEIGLVSTEQLPRLHGGTVTQISLHLTLWTDALPQGSAVPHGKARAVPHGKAPTTSKSIVKNHTSSNPQTPKGAEIALSEFGFDDFWNLYPRKSAKPKAATAFARKTKKTDEALCIRNGLREWVKFWKADETEERFIPHPTTFLNQERYLDRPPTLAEKKGAMSIIEKLASRDHA